MLRSKSLYLCRFVSFLIYGFTHLSSFILASVSIDRAIATNFINFSKVYCKPNMAYKIIALNILLASAIDFHNLIFMGHSTQEWNSDAVTNIDQQYMKTLGHHGSSSNNFSDEFNKESVLKNSSFLITVHHCESIKDTNYDKFIDPYFRWIDLLGIIPTIF